MHAVCIRAYNSHAELDTLENYGICPLDNEVRKGKLGTRGIGVCELAPIVCPCVSFNVLVHDTMDMRDCGIFATQTTKVCM